MLTLLMMLHKRVSNTLLETRKRANPNAQYLFQEYLLSYVCANFDIKYA